MTKDEALKMAHKSFMQLNERHPRKDNGNGYFDEEIQACKEALEQPAQEPVKQKVKVLYEKNRIQTCEILPAPAWQGLSDDEVNDLHHKWIMNNGNKDTQYDFARAIEQALKEKNT